MNELLCGGIMSTRRNVLFIIAFLFVLNFVDLKSLTYSFSDHFSDYEPKCGFSLTQSYRINDYKGDYLDDIYDFDVIKYDINIDVSDTINSTVIGNVIITANTTITDFSEIIIDLVDEMGIDSVFYSNNSYDNYEIDIENDILRENDRLFISIPEIIVNEGDEFIIDLFYSGAPPSGSYFNLAYEVSSHSGAAVIYTLSAPQGARYWMACKDIPKDKAVVDFKVTCWNHQKVMANGLIQDVIDEGNGKHTYFYKENYPVATYLIALAVSNYATHTIEYSPFYGSSEDIMPVELYVYPELYDISIDRLSNITDMLACYEEKFGEYPFIEEKYGMAHFPWGGGMENQTCTHLGPSTMNTDVVPHELAHQWLGDKVTCESFDDIWLNEGGATWAEAIWNEYLDGEAGYLQSMSGFRNGALGHPNDPLFGFSDTYNRFIYVRGAWTYHMLRYMLGEDKFWDAFYSYLNESQYIYSAASTSDFINYLQDHSGVNLQSFLNQWMYGSGHPEYVFSYVVENNSESSSILKIQITQEQETTSTIPIFDMPIPIMIQFSDFTDTLLVLENSNIFTEYEFNFDKRIHNNISLEENFNYKQKILCTAREEEFNGINYELQITNYELKQNYPNPFNPVTKINYELRITNYELAEIVVYNSAGQQIWSSPITHHALRFTGSILFDGSKFNSGIYYYSLVVDGKRMSTKSMVLIK